MHPLWLRSTRLARPVPRVWCGTDDRARLHGCGITSHYEGSFVKRMFRLIPLLFPPPGGEVYEAGVWGQSHQATPGNIPAQNRR